MVQFSSQTEENLFSLSECSEPSGSPQEGMSSLSLGVCKQKVEAACAGGQGLGAEKFLDVPLVPRSCVGGTDIHARQ